MMKRWWALFPASFVFGCATIYAAAVQVISPLEAIGVILAAVLTILASASLIGRRC
jgi:hypothetical protein